MFDAIIEWGALCGALTAIGGIALFFLLAPFKSRDLFRKAMDFKKSKSRHEHVEAEKPVSFGPWLYITSDPAPRLPLCPNCTAPDIGGHYRMCKTKNPKHSRGSSLSWEYRCPNCGKAYEVPNSEIDLLLLKLGDNRENKNF